MLRAIIRYLLVSIHSFFEGLTIVFFENIEIVSTNFLVKERIKSPSEEQQILVKYLEGCRKQVMKVENGKRKTKPAKKTNRKTKEIL